MNNPKVNRRVIAKVTHAVTYCILSPNLVLSLNDP